MVTVMRRSTKLAARLLILGIFLGLPFAQQPVEQNDPAPPGQLVNLDGRKLHLFIAPGQGSPTHSCGKRVQ